MGVFSVVVAAAAVASGGGKLQDNCIHSCLSVQIYIYFRYMLYIYIAFTNSSDFLDITEEAERPANLNQPIVFKQRHKPTKAESESDKTDKSKAKKSDKSEKSRKKSKASSASKLSFNEDEEDADAEADED